MKIPQFLLEIPEFEKLEPLNSGGSVGNTLGCFSLILINIKHLF